jgi:flagellar basal-body rod protein FlgG
MFQPLYVAATGLNTFEDEMTDISNNMANAKTIAFKKGRTDKESLFYVEKTFDSKLAEAMKKANGEPAGSLEYGTGVRVVSTLKDFSQGTIENTNQPMDLAIQGEGFFQIRMPDGSQAYSRAGNFHIDNEGNVVDPNGKFLDPPLSVPQGTTSVLVKSDGTVSVSINNSSNLMEIGQINLAKFPNPAGLKSIGQNLYAQTDASGYVIIGTPTQDNFGAIQQGALEQSNVDIISEMMRMIAVQRVFDTVTKAVSTYEAMLTKLEGMKS